MADNARMKSLFAEPAPAPEPSRPSAAAALAETFTSMPAEGWWAVGLILLAILVSRDCVIVRLRRLVKGAPPPTRDAVAPPPPPSNRQKAAAGNATPPARKEKFPETNKFFDSLFGQSHKKKD